MGRSDLRFRMAGKVWVEETEFVEYDQRGVFVIHLS